MISALLAVSIALASPVYTKADVLAAIRQVESGGKENPPDGDNGRAIGPYQIWHPYWLEAVLYVPKIKGTYQDCRKRAYAEKVVDAYMRRYAKSAWSDKMTLADARKVARIHNGGPQGHTRKATIIYWNKVKKHLKK